LRISVVTPSYRSSQWLRLCIASVADQPAQAEHIIQDAGSDDGTLDWLRTDNRVRAFVEKDRGMYDALNRGFRRATGNILAWLNCDEQYLPGALPAVVDFFASHPEIQVAFGDVLFADRQGEYLFHRKMQTPQLCHTWTCHLSTLSCGIFFRRELFADQGYQFNADYRDAGDADWMLRMMRNRVPMATLTRFTSVYTMTGGNMSAADNARRENRQLRDSAPALVRALRPWWIAQHRLRRWLGGMYRQDPFDFELYTLNSPAARVTRHVARPRGTYSPQ
jgi:glycosyltransferase involved in cell wall biosynthesis